MGLDKNLMKMMTKKKGKEKERDSIIQISANEYVKHKDSNIKENDL